MTAAIPRQLSVNNQFEMPNSNDICMDTSSYPICHYLEQSSLVDVMDNPLFWKSDATDQNIFMQMKLESNRLHSFQNRWPLKNVVPESLAEAGFFYLQEEDIVQCPFCGIKISDWMHKDKPLREHMRRNPRCHFLIGCDVGNVPLAPERNHEMQPVFEKVHLPAAVSISYKPKHPRMADLKRRILTFSNWPLNNPAAQKLADCGLFYSGVADVVTCFFCGGALGNWDQTDDPWDEHTKFFPDCAFLAVAKNRHNRSSKVLATSRQKSNESAAFGDTCTKLPTTSGALSEIIQQARDIFPENLVLEALKRIGSRAFSLQEICDEILEIKLQENRGRSAIFDVKKPEINQVGSGLKANSEIIESKDNDGSCGNDALICKVCMDRERSAVFQPCGHFVSCWNCANLISNCPVCRRPIIHKIRTYVS